MDMENTTAKNLSKKKPVLESVTFRFKDDFEFTLTGEEFRRELAKVVGRFLDHIVTLELVKHIFGDKEG